MLSILLSISLAVVAILLIKILKPGKGSGNDFPKGPFAWPIFGNSLQLTEFPHKKLTEWSKIYGDVYRIWFGSNPCVIVTDLKLAKELLADPAFNYRSTNDVFELFTDGPHGIVASEGPEWTEQRRFTLRHLRDFGFGKSKGEELIMSEVTELLDQFAKDTGKPRSIHKSFNAAIINTLWMIMAGVRYEQDDPRLWSIFKLHKEVMTLMSTNPFLMFLPRLSKKFPRILGWQRVVKFVRSMQQEIKGHVDEHVKSFSPEEGVLRDFIDVYLTEINATTDPDSSFYKDAGLKSLRAVMTDLFVAGHETASETLSWATLHLVKYPEIKRKFQEELDRVVGRNRRPCLADRPKLAFVEATIAESMRLSSIIPLGLFRSTSEDVKIRQYRIPKGTWIDVPIWHFHYDPKHFPNPNQFLPERFLSADGKSFVKHEAWMPFSFGKRQCPGETLARDEVFLFLTNMFHRFDISSASQPEKLSLEPMPGFVLCPQPYQVVINERA